MLSDVHQLHSEYRSFQCQIPVCELYWCVVAWYKKIKLGSKLQTF